MTRALLNSSTVVEKEGGRGVVVSPKNGIIPRKRWSEIVDVNTGGERETERERMRCSAKVRKGRRHATRRVMQWRTRKSRATHRHFTPFYAPPRLSHVVHGLLRRSPILYRVCTCSIESEVQIDISSFLKLESIHFFWFTLYSRMLRGILVLYRVCTHFSQMQRSIFRIGICYIKIFEIRILYSKVRLKRSKVL